MRKMSDSKKQELKAFIIARTICLLLVIVTLANFSNAIGVTVGISTFIGFTVFAYIEDFC